VWLALVCSLGLTLPAAKQLDFQCSRWTRLSADQKLQAIDLAIEDLISSSRGREYPSLNRVQTKRCLERSRDGIVDDFDEICSRGMRADLQALNKTFRSYAWSCAR
jgi:hypothetical protein